MKAILRTKKHKTKGTLAASSRHTFREEETPNADPARTDKNRLLIGTGSIDADVHQRIKDAGVTPGKNSVLAVEFMLTASPEYFGGEGFGDWDQKKTDDFIDAAKKFMAEKYGENVVSLAVHLDEKTPHLVGHVVPINPATNRLSAKAMITGGREMLRKLQDDFAASVAHLGLERGLKGSQAEHKSIKKWYAEGNEVERSAKNISVAKLPTPPIFGRDEWVKKANDQIKQKYTKFYEVNTKLQLEKEEAVKTAQRAARKLELIESGVEHENLQKAAKKAEEKALAWQRKLQEEETKRFEAETKLTLMKKKYEPEPNYTGVTDAEIDRKPVNLEHDERQHEPSSSKKPVPGRGH